MPRPGEESEGARPAHPGVPAAEVSERILPRRGDVLLVALAPLLALLPGVFGEFLNWDDNRNYLDIASYRGLGLPRLAWMFTAFHMGHYHPLTWLTLGADHAIWGLDPFGFHLTSLLLHAGAAVAFLHVARRLLRLAGPGALGDPALRIGAVAAALLFAVHPLRVESVVWLSERRDVLSGLLYLLTVLAYLRAAAAREAGAGASALRWLAGALVLFAAAILSKALVVSLPAVLLILDVYPLRRLGGAAGWRTPAARRVLVEKVPFVLLALAGTLVAFLARAPLGSAIGLRDFGLAERAAVSAYGYAFYLRKTLVPTGLSPLYEMSAGFNLLGAPLAWSLAIVLPLGAVAILMRRRWPALAAAAAAYAVTLLPVIGVVQSGPQITADRYTYLACLGWALLAGGGVARCAERWMAGARGRILWGGALAAATLAIVALAGATARQSLVWLDSVSLWTQVLAVDPASPRAHTGLAGAHFAAGRNKEARQHIDEAMKLSPGLPEALMGLATLLTVDRRAEEALPHARSAVARRPWDPGLRHALGEILRLADRREEAVEELRAAARLDPHWALPRFVTARTLAEMGRTREALAALAQADGIALAQNPDDPERARFEAFVHAGTDPERAIAAWDRYLAAVTRARSLSRQEMAQALEGLGAREALRGRADAGAAERR